MIGVSICAELHDVAREFFELFKVPWEFAVSGVDYEVLLCDGDELSIVSSRLTVLLPPTPNTMKGEEVLSTGLRINSSLGALYLYTNVSEVVRGASILHADMDHRSVAGVEQSGTGTKIHLGYHLFAEVKHLLVLGQPALCADTPTLDRHITLLRHWILCAGVRVVEVPPSAFGTNCFTCLTHDVDFAGLRNHVFDRTALGFVFRSLFRTPLDWLRGRCGLYEVLCNWLWVLLLPLVHLGIVRDPWDTFSLYREIEGPFPSTFYFVPWRGRAGRLGHEEAPRERAVKYDVVQLASTIRRLRDAGCEIGVHGIDSWNDSVSGSTEKRHLQGLAENEISGIRMHWLYFDASSAEVLERAGYRYDSTCGFNEAVGYRAGTSQVFRPVNCETMLELPMHIMDTALFYPRRGNLSAQEGKARIKEMLEHVAADGGVLTVNWHDRSLAPERHWGKVYSWLVGELRSVDARIETAAVIVEWFRLRRALRYSRGINGTVQLHRPDWVGDCGLQIRIHTPVAKADNDYSAPSCSVEVSDRPVKPGDNMVSGACRT